MAGLLKTNVQLGDSSTATQNFTLTAAAADGTMKLARGNFGATSQDVITIDSNGKAAFPQGFGSGNTNQSMVKVNGANGYGGTNTKIRRFANITNGVNGCIIQGTDITITDSAANSTLFTINVAGVYSINYVDNCTSGSMNMGLSLNSSQLTTNIQGITVADVLGCVYTPAANAGAYVGSTQYFAAGSLVRAHTDGSAAGTPPITFTIQRVA